MTILYLIVPYRNRKTELDEFIPYMCKYLEFHKINFKIIVVSQDNDELFNKGVLFNIGVKYVEKCEENKKNVYMCFHDVDILPAEEVNYNKPNDGEINHLYGYKFCLGGVFTINYKDYVKINGFSNIYEGWGYEDTDFRRRAISTKININRSYFYSRFDKHFKELNDEDSVKKMSLPQTVKNRIIFKKNEDNSGFDKLKNCDEVVKITECNNYTIVSCFDLLKVFSQQVFS